MLDPAMLIGIVVVVVIGYVVWMNSRNWDGVRWVLTLKGYDDEAFRLARSFGSVTRALLFVAALPDRGKRK